MISLGIKERWRRGCARPSPGHRSSQAQAEVAHSPVARSPQFAGTAARTAADGATSNKSSQYSSTRSQFFYSGTFLSFPKSLLSNLSRIGLFPKIISFLQITTAMGKVGQRRIYFVLERKKRFFAKMQQTVAFHFIKKAE
jgi:hypothetical protein